jgi:hypothetical protein
MMMTDGEKVLWVSAEARRAVLSRKGDLLLARRRAEECVAQVMRAEAELAAAELTLRVLIEKL